MTRRNLIRAAVLLALVAAVAAVWMSPLRQELTPDRARALVSQLRGLWYGPLLFVLVFTLACVVALPASIFVLAAGLIWGWLAGALYSIAGGLLGALASFAVARFVGEGLLERFGRVGRLVARQVDHAGFRSLLILRFIPGIPFAVLNYGAGVAGVRLRDFVPATIIGITPPMFVFAWCADSLFNGSMTEGDAVRRLAIVGALMIGLVMLPQLVKRIARRTGGGPPGPAESA